METLQAGRKFGCYELIRLLGEGGMGEVWLAHDEPADRSVALKFIKPHLLNNPGMRTRFTNEARTLGKLEQDRIVTLYTVVEEDEHLAFVLRFIEGQSLADRIDTQSPLAMSFILSSARDILAALGEAHQRGIIHRDIKPQNILVDSKDRSFLTDFGIAVTDFLERATVGAFAIGTPHYMSPEQITRPRDITIAKGGQRTDIYSYGVVLYEMLTGQVPFGQDSGAEEIYTIQQAHCQDAPPRLRMINAAISPAMEEVVLHCLEKNPDDRPQTCAALLAEIEAAAAAGMVEVQPTRTRTRTVIEETGRAAAVAPGAGAFVQQPQAAAFGSSKKRSAGQRNLMLSAAGLLLAGGLGFTLYRATGKHSAEAPPAPASSGPAVAPAPIGATPPAGTEGKPTNTPVPVAGGGGKIKPKDPTQFQQDPIRASPKPDDSTAKEAAGFANEAGRKYKALDYCGADDDLKQAIALHPDPKYVRLETQYKYACDHPS